MDNFPVDFRRDVDFVCFILWGFTWGCSGVTPDWLRNHPSGLRGPYGFRGLNWQAPSCISSPASSGIESELTTTFPWHRESWKDSLPRNPTNLGSYSPLAGEWAWNLETVFIWQLFLYCSILRMMFAHILDWYKLSKMSIFTALFFWHSLLGRIYDGNLVLSVNIVVVVWNPEGMLPSFKFPRSFIVNTFSKCLLCAFA